LFFNLGRPSHFEAFLDAHVHGTVVFMVGQCAICFGALALWNFQFVAQIDRGDAEEFFLGLDAAFDFCFQLVCCGDSARFQRACKCAGQSTGQG
jgi:hypothetical protein